MSEADRNPPSQKDTRAHRRRPAGAICGTVHAIAAVSIFAVLWIAIRGFTTDCRSGRGELHLQLIIHGIIRYEKLHGMYPEPRDNTGRGRGGARALYQALSGDGDNHLIVDGNRGSNPSIGKIGSSGEVLAEGIDPKSNKHHLVGEDLALIDRFGRYWHYKRFDEDKPDLTMHNRSFDIWSYDEDVDGDNEAKWIKNW